MFAAKRLDAWREIPLLALLQRLLLFFRLLAQLVRALH